MNYPLRSGGGSHNIVTDYEYDALNRLDWQVNFVDLAELKTELKGMRVNSTGMERATARGVASTAATAPGGGKSRGGSSSNTRSALADDRESNRTAPQRPNNDLRPL